MNATNRIGRQWNVALNIVFILFALICILPVLLIFIVSFSSENSIFANGYTFFPTEWSVEGYTYLFRNKGVLINSYSVTIFITIVGTVLNLMFTSAFAYPLSRSVFSYKKFFAVMVLIPMLFSGGMVSTYLIYTTVLKLKDSLIALILPGVFNGFSAFIMRTYFKSNIPDSLIESAYIDGANEYLIFFRIVLPLAVPIIASLAFTCMLGYWNEWFNAMLYIDNAKLFPVQYVMMKSLRDLQYLKSNLQITGGYGYEEVSRIPSESVRMAMTVMAVAPVLCVYPFFQKYFVQGLTIGAVKG